MSVTVNLIKRHYYHTAPDYVLQRVTYMIHLSINALLRPLEVFFFHPIFSSPSDQLGLDSSLSLPPCI